MAFAFHCAGFAAIDVHMTDILSHRVSLSTFVGMAACGGFSYGDVLGAGQGWAKSVLLHPETRAEFKTFFERKDTFTLGVCNGCQFLSKLKAIVPGSSDWPSFERNVSEQYEARFCMVKITEPPKEVGMSPSVFFHGMNGSSFPVAVAHGEGRVSFGEGSNMQALTSRHLAPLRYVDNRTLQPTMAYPFNPNGSPEGIAGVRSADGRVLALMPHPERTVLGGIGSWIPDARMGIRDEGEEGWGDFGPWIRLFQSARRWVG
jgi:phosphoribosylformylglycinamidine synthase